MRALVRVATSLEVRPQENETQALLLENHLIRTLRPPYNVDGAYAFLYPALGVGSHGGRLLLAFTSAPEEWSDLDVRWHGCFRSRVRSRAAFDALVSYRGPDLLRMKGLLNVEGSDKPVVVHGVQHVFHPPAMLDAWPDADRRSKLVFITRNIEQGTIRRLFAAFTDGAREAAGNTWDDIPGARP